MKIVQSFWSKPFMHSESFLVDSRINGGWPHRILHYYSCALSCLRLREFYEDVELITDDLGKEIMIDKMKLPFTYVRLALNDMQHVPAGLWTLGKVYSYGIQEVPFLHIDNDVFIGNKFEDTIMESGLIAQNAEMKTPGNAHTLREMCESFTGMPSYVQDLLHYKYTPNCNAGIIGGHDIDFFRAYSKDVFSVLNANIDKINDSLHYMNAAHVSVILEQVFFYAYAGYSGHDIKYLFPDTDDFPADIGFFHASPENKHFVHCFGFYKKIRGVYSMVEKTLKTIYPDYYQRINDLVNYLEL